MAARSVAIASKRLIMATNAEWHDRVTASIGGAEKYGRGIWPNPWVEKMPEYARRILTRGVRDELSHKIRMLSEPRFHTGGETSELMESLITIISAKQILELGTHTGRSTLHFLRAIVGIEGATVVSIDARPTHDREFFAKPEIAKHFQFIEGWTPQCLPQLASQKFDFVFVDSAHDLEHTQEEMAALEHLTKSGSMICLHDIPRWRTPALREPPPVRVWLEEQIRNGGFTGMMLPSPMQLDCLEEYGPSYPPECNPGLAVLIKA